ncbi:MAG: glycoside hydrolase family 2 TIM barrel-domain containing protein, partial [Alistipes sp.]
SLRVDVSNTWQNDVLPTSSDMNLYGGIYRKVELIVTDRTAISPLYLGSEGVLVHPTNVTRERVEGEAEIHLTSSASGESCTVSLELTSPDGYQACTRTVRARLDGKPVMVPFEFERPSLWSPSTPALYTLTAAVDHNGVRDTVCLRTGFRMIGVSATGGFTLNGNRLNIKGVSLYHDNISSGSALSEADYDADLAMIRAMGANAVRSAAMPHAQYFYDRCDSEGLLAWVELPFLRAPFFGDVDYFATQRFEQNGRQQLRELIAQNINHPSVAMWGIFSCLWSRGDDVTPYLRSLNSTAHAMDSSRPTVACSNQDGNINFITDLIVWQQNVGWDRGSSDDLKVWSALLRTKWGKLCSAVIYGAEGMPGHSSFEAQPSTNINWLPENRQTQFHEGYARQLDSDSLFWGVWINNMFDFGSARRPYGVNASGLVTLNRREVKDAYYLYKALWNKQSPTLHITDKRRRLRAGEAQQFTIYAQQQPTLRINGAPVAVREWAPCQYKSDTVMLNGHCKVEATLGELTDCAEITVGNVLKQQRRQAPLRREDLQPIN